MGATAGMGATVAAGVWGMGLPWMGVPPPIVLGALSLDLFLARRGPGVAGALFGIVFTVSDFPVTAILSGRSWTGLEFAGTQVAAAAAGWVSAGPLDPPAECAIIQQLNFERSVGGAE